MPNVIVVGGGLAGMLSARALAREGFSVTLFEASDQVGGKAGCHTVGGIVREHGYHIFPAWYANVRAITTELGISLIDFDRWHYIRPGGLANPITMRVPDSVTSFAKAFTGGLLPWPDTILYWYFVLDMLGEPLSNKAVLDQVSRLGMMRDRWYVTDKIPEMEAENVLKASAIPVFNLSAMTAKIISAYWVRAPSPFLSILTGDLQSHFIEPIRASTVAAGVNIELSQEVVELKVTGNQISGIVTKDSASVLHTHTADEYIVTAPLQVTRKLMNAKLHELNPDLGDFEHLEAAPMASYHLTLNKIIPDMPKEHVFLVGGKYGLSFIDQRTHWGLPTTMLSCISSNFTVLQDLPHADQEKELFAELSKYTGITMADVDTTALLSNTDDPLFINTIGAWASRPDARADGVGNLFFAGDWVRNPIDLACMEGAVWSALTAAREIGKKHGKTLAAPHTPKKFPPVLMRAAKWALAPAMVPVWAAAKSKLFG